MIISNLHDGAGFFSAFFFTMNHYIFCKKNNICFKLDTNKWLFKYKQGWTDYFEDIVIHDNDVKSKSNTTDNEIQIVNFGDILYEYPITEYKRELWNLYKYNSTTIQHINETKHKLGLQNTEYGSIFIRRGDKLIHESKYHPTEKYIELLLEKYPNCKTIFLQTDDYNCYIDLENYIKQHGLNITLLTLCDKTAKGALVIDYSGFYSIIQKNQQYMNNINNTLMHTKSVMSMSNDEKYQHTMTMLVGLDIVFHSKFCILDYQSNVSRFIKLAHDIPENVFDIDGFEIDFNKKICPAYPESVYTDIGTYKHL